MLIMGVKVFRKEMLQYYNFVQSRLLEQNAERQVSIDTGLIYELVGTSLGALAMANRLQTALGDYDPDQLEIDAIAYASELVELEAKTVSDIGWASFYLCQKAAVATSVIKSAPVWKPEAGRLIEKWQFDSWCEAMQRDPCGCSTV